MTRVYSLRRKQCSSYLMTMSHCQQKLQNYLIPISFVIDTVKYIFWTTSSSMVLVRNPVRLCVLYSDWNFHEFYDILWPGLLKVLVFWIYPQRLHLNFNGQFLISVSISVSKERRRGYVVDIIVSALFNYGRFYGRLRLPGAHSQIWANHFYGAMWQTWIIHSTDWLILPPIYY
jgi:hypothetical protein